MDGKVGNQGSQRSLRNVWVVTAKNNPNTAQWWRRIITGNFWEMGMDVIPGIYKGSALTIRGTPRFLLVRMVRFEIHSLFAYIVCSESIGDNLFSLTVGRALAFRWHHGASVDRSKQMKVFEKENTVKKGKWRKCLCWKGRRRLCLEYERIFS